MMNLLVQCFRYFTVILLINDIVIAFHKHHAKAPSVQKLSNSRNFSSFFGSRGTINHLNQRSMTTMSANVPKFNIDKNASKYFKRAWAIGPTILTNVLVPYQVSTFSMPTTATFRPTTFITKSLAGAEELNSASISALENILRVSGSLKYILSDIDNGSDYKSIFSQVKLLLVNYKLRDNIQVAVATLPSQSRSQGQQFGNDAYEYLIQISEYFKDGYDIAATPRDILTFAQSGVQAAEKQLNSLVDLFPSDTKSQLRQKINEEFNFIEK